MESEVIVIKCDKKKNYGNKQGFKHQESIYESAYKTAQKEERNNRQPKINTGF